MISILKKIFGREKLEDNVSITDNAVKSVKETAKKSSLEEVREKARAIHRSSCGCYRHGARDLFYQELDGNPYRTAELYKIISLALHSYCNSTGSSYSSSNNEVVRKAFYATREIISEAKNENLEEIIRDQSRIINDLRQDSGGNLNRQLSNENLQSLIQSAINLGNAERYFESILVLDNASKIARTMKLDTQKEIITDLKKSYLFQAIREIKNSDKELKVKASKVYSLGNVFSNEEVGKKLLDKSQRLNSLVDKPMKSDERLASYIGCYFDDNKIMPLERNKREIKSDLERSIKKINEETENKRKSLAEKINYLKGFEINDNVLEKMIDYERQFSSLKREAEERANKIENEELIKLSEVENEIELFRKERDYYTDKIYTRKLTKPEYKFLLTKMRLKEKQ